MNRFAAAVLVASLSCLLIADWSGVRFALSHEAPVTCGDPPNCYTPPSVASCADPSCDVAPPAIATFCKGDECFVPPADDCDSPPDCLAVVTS
jgi:hypothetical protein